MNPPALQDVLNLALSLFSTAISIFALWLSVRFYQLSNDLNNRMVQTISELAVSAKTTEATTTRITSRALDVLAGHFEHRIEEAEEESRVEVARSVARALATAPPREREKAQAAATRAVADAFDRLKDTMAPASHEYDWRPFVRRVRELQRANQYLSVKWLHQKVFAEEPSMQQALQVALAREMLRTYQLSNPRNPEHPTLCCEVNPGHPVIVELDGTGG
jgi:hypothetical protein